MPYCGRSADNRPRPAEVVKAVRPADVVIVSILLRRIRPRLAAALQIVGDMRILKLTVIAR